MALPRRARRSEPGAAIPTAAARGPRRKRSASPGRRARPRPSTRHARRSDASGAARPLVEMPAAPAPAFRTTFVVLLTGDGGWAGLDGTWPPRSAWRHPGGSAEFAGSTSGSAATRTSRRRTCRIVARYGEAWRRHGVPDRLLVQRRRAAVPVPAAAEADAASVYARSALAPRPHADFEFHLSDWLPVRQVRATRPEIERMGAARVLCLHPSEKANRPATARACRASPR